MAEQKTPRKTKTKAKRRRARSQARQRDLRLPPISLARRKDIIASVIGDVVGNTDSPEAQLEMAGHVMNCGLAELGKLLDMDTSNAVVLFPEDAEIDLIRAAIVHADETNQPFRDVVDAMISKLSSNGIAATVN